MYWESTTRRQLKRACRHSIRSPPASSPASATQPATQPATQRDAPPPSDAAVRRMGVAAAVAALRAHVAVARVAEETCAQLAALSGQRRLWSALFKL